MRASLPILLVSLPCLANQLGVVGYSGKGAESCNNCHTGGATPTVAITGPSTLQAGQTGTYQVSISGGAGSRAGMNVAVDVPAAQLLAVAGDSVSFSNEVHHSAPKAFSGGRATFSFRVLAPNFAGPVRLFAAGNSCNGNGSTSGDRAAMTTLQVQVTGGSTAPRIATEASSMPATVSGTTARLAVLGADDQPETALTYTWSMESGPGAVTFSPNGSNAAKQTTATFSRAGDHVLRVIATDAQGQAAASTVRVPVLAGMASISVTPQQGQVEPGRTLQFTARALDQFGGSMTTPATFTWSVTGGGTINSAGLYTARSLGGPHVVQAISMGRSGAGSVRVVEKVMLVDQSPPVVSMSAPAAGERLAGKVTIGVEATDDVGVTKVEVLVNGASAGSATAPPWRVAIDTAAYPSGPATLTVVAFDAAGNRGERALEVVLDNPMTPPAQGCSAVSGSPLLAFLLFALRRRR
ncbi:MAG: PKD domain-containing protein [Myxococcaceae bacterium]|nr:PKD domain-containing protein [Myxococcaceae bacterium]